MAPTRECFDCSIDPEIPPPPPSSSQISGNRSGRTAPMLVTEKLPLVDTGKKRRGRGRKSERTERDRERERGGGERERETGQLGPCNTVGSENRVRQHIKQLTVVTFCGLTSTSFARNRFLELLSSMGRRCFLMLIICTECTGESTQCSFGYPNTLYNGQDNPVHCWAIRLQSECR
jgi:hypothetical protein